MNKYLEEAPQGDIMYGGCDPGLAGGFVVIADSEIKYKIAIPTISFTTKQGRTKKEIDRGGIMSFLKTLPAHMHVAIEEQQAFRRQDIQASCTTCKNYGLLLMALSVAHMYITEVPSDTWQGYFGIVSVKKGEGKTTKEQAANIAQAIYPNMDFRKSERSHIVHDGIVDACLLSVYCNDLFEGNK